MANLHTEAFKTFIDLLLEHYESVDISEEVVTHMRFDVPSYAYATGYNPLTLRDPFQGTSKHCKKLSRRQLQRTNTSHKVYRKKPRHDFVIVESEVTNIALNFLIMSSSLFGSKDASVFTL